jgi:arsenate reductase
MLSDHRIHLDVYGLRNCDRCRHALRWLEMRRVPCTFHDVRQEGLDPDRLGFWLESAHGPYLVNRRSTTWRKLSLDERQLAQTEPKELLLDHPTLLKRPVITDGRTILDVGFEPENLEDYI